MDPYLRQRETVAEKLSSSPGILRRGKKAWLTLGIGLFLVLGFWFVLFETGWILGAGTGVSGYLQTASSTGLENHPGTVTVSSDDVVRATGEATAEDGFNVELDPGTYQLVGATSGGGTCFSRTVEVEERGFTEANLTCRRP